MTRRPPRSLPLALAGAPDAGARRARLLAAHDRLCRAYDAPIAFFRALDPLSELVSSLLSHRTRNSASGRAFRALRALYPDWAAARDAPVADVERAIAEVTWPEQKAPRIQGALRAIAAARGGDLSLDFLAGLPVREARDWLEAIPGVGPKTSAAVLLFSTLRRPALPVDGHHHRVALRLGLLPPGTPVGPAHAALDALLPADWDAQTVYDHHEVLMLHGQRCCFFRAPACPRCPVLDLCPAGAAAIAGRPAPPVSAEESPAPPAVAPAEGPAPPAGRDPGGESAPGVATRETNVPTGE
jgi:endonuclease-3